jgi:hypothetical protein
MAEVAPAAVTPTPSAHPNAPPAVAAPVTPPVAPPEDLGQKYKALETAHERKTREHIIERRKWEASNKSALETKTKLDALEKREAQARMNPPAFLKSIYGEQWHEVINEAKLNGVPPGQLIAEEMQKLREEMDAKYRARDEEALSKQAAAKEQAVDEARKSIFAESAEWYRAKADEFPILKKLGDAPAVARTISQRIEAEFHRQGKVLTTGEAAELIEAEVLDWAAEAGKHEKYKAKLQPAIPSATVNPSKQQQVLSQKPAAARRSVTNDITGSTPAAKPPASDAERRARAIAASKAVMNRG